MQRRARALAHSERSQTLRILFAENWDSRELASRPLVVIPTTCVSRALAVAARFFSLFFALVLGSDETQHDAWMSTDISHRWQIATFRLFAVVDFCRFQIHLDVQ